MRHDLRGEQLPAVTSLAPRTFIEAGPGTGKTTVAVERFGYLRYQQGHGEKGIVAVSFTIAATNELRQRILSRWGSGALLAPSRVRTIDSEITNLLCLLLRHKKVAWPGGVTELAPVDSCRHHPSWKLNRDRKYDSWRPGLVDGVVQPVKAVKPALSITKADLKKLLADGFCTHEDVRTIVKTALADPELRAFVVAHRRATVAHFIVDEVFDADELDLDLIRLHCEAEVPVTVAGDHWQALYEFRQAVPSKVAAALDPAGDLGFTASPLTESHRFVALELKALASDLRLKGCVLPAPNLDSVEIVLAPDWRSLWDCPDWVMPLQLGRIWNDADAMLTLLICHVARRSFDVPLRFQHEAMMKLGASIEDLNKWTEHFNTIEEILRGASHDSASGAFDALRTTRKLTGTGSVLSSPSKENTEDLVASMSALANRVNSPGKLVPGITVHQAKGRQWRSVAVGISTADAAAMAAGLDRDNADHRRLYVAFTRATHSITCIEL